MVGMAHTGMPQHVPQRKQNDCAIATVAMVANVPYEDIAKRHPIRIGARGIYPRELHSMLVAATGVPWQRPLFGWLRPIARCAIAPNPMVVIDTTPLEVAYSALRRTSRRLDP